MRTKWGIYITRGKGLNKAVSLLLALVLCMGLVLALPISVGAVEILNGMGTITVYETIVGFAGQE